LSSKLAGSIMTSFVGSCVLFETRLVL